MMHELPADLQEALNGHEGAKRGRNEEVLEDWEAVFDALRELHRVHPEWRFGQMVANLAVLAGETAPGEPYSVRDPDLLEAARRHLAGKHAAGKQTTDAGDAA
jgi:hypothetical protein